jgi:hypothetical protein
MVVVYGDLHISSDRPWSLDVSKKVCDTIIGHESNKEENSLILTGDITDKNTVDGSVIDLLHYLFENLKYKNTYICVGNHEGRIKHKKLSTTYDFLENPKYKSHVLSSIHIIRELREVLVEGMSTLFLPHIYPTENKSLSYYSDLPKEIRDKEYDLILGHITDSRLSFPSTDKIDISYLKSKRNIMGHIHSGEYKDLGYLGSFIPNSVSETDFPRYRLLIKKEVTGILTETWEVLDPILEYKEVDYPSPLVRTKAPVVVWSFTNCADEEVARSFYKKPEMFIRKCTYSSQIDKDGFQDLIKNANSLQNFKFYLNDWMDNKAKALTTTLKSRIEYYASKVQNN